MPRALDPFRFLLRSVAGWMNERQLQAIDYLREENRILREQLGQRRVRLNDDQRRRRAAKAKGLGRKLLAEVATIVTPERRDREISGSHGRGQPGLGLSAHSGRTVESRARGCPKHDRCDS